MTEGPAQDKTAAEIKAEAFAENPDKFVDIRDVLFLVMRDKERGILLVNNCKSREDCRDVSFESNVSILERHAMLGEIARRDAQKIVKVNGNGNGHKLLDHLRGRR